VVELIPQDLGHPPRIAQYLDHISFHDIVAMLGESEGEDSQEPVVDRALSDNDRDCPTLLLGLEPCPNPFENNVFIALHVWHIVPIKQDSYRCR